MLWASLVAVLTGMGQSGNDSIIRLPRPDTVGRVTVEQSLLHRRSHRAYSGSLTLVEAGQVLWAAQGSTSSSGGRTAPSAGATYPMDLYLVAAGVDGLKPGLYQYETGGHALRLVREGDVRKKLAGAAWGQTIISSAPAVLVLCAVYSRTTGRYGDRGVRYVHMEAGHVGQNVYLQCEALGLGTVMIGAFQDERVKELVGTRAEPLYLMPFGRIPR